MMKLNNICKSINFLTGSNLDVMQKNERMLPIYSGASGGFEPVNLAQNQWRLCTMKFRVRSFQKWMPSLFG